MTFTVFESAREVVACVDFVAAEAAATPKAIDAASAISTTRTVI